MDALPLGMSSVLTDILGSPAVSHVSLELFRAPPPPHAPAPTPLERTEIDRWNLLAPYASNGVYNDALVITNEKRRV